MDRSDTRTGNPAVQNTNFVSPCPVYTFEFTVNLLEFNPAYPKDPKTLGEQIRKARMDQHLMVKELAERVGVVPETVINWEKRNLKPIRRHLERL